jgi:hypothetical protein
VSRTGEGRAEQAWEQWVIDASMAEPYREGFACFCPLEGDIDGDFKIVVGLSVFSDVTPHAGKMVAVVHSDGQQAVEEWCDRNADFLAALASPTPAPSEP